MNDQECRRSIDLALVQMEKQFGKGAILRLGSKTVVPVAVISSGSISIDNALGVGGGCAGRSARSGEAGSGGFRARQVTPNRERDNR